MTTSNDIVFTKQNNIKRGGRIKLFSPTHLFVKGLTGQLCTEAPRPDRYAPPRSIEPENNKGADS
ncbi:hypothetical protein EYF80_021320 [Liparis tanakae]|uniref:Uncharacterized protein n=1 Tax=Liparis tanakae TaxID=230148 RepID=A0A4Z2HRE1_9TELE|nr:hypothetical protein EYF80_021320 [Liparis tanakae]